MTTAAISGAPKAGDVFADKYRIERVLGVGGMGYVIAAVHMHLDERVAIKLLLPEHAQSEEVVARFLREGRAAVKIKSEHVGKIIDVGSANGTPYIVMEYLDGRDLSQLIEDRGRIVAPIVADYVLQACEAIAEAHAMGTVHRDLKPANLFLIRTRDGRDCVKVLDFGISKVANPEGAQQLSMTRTSAMMGSPLYMSPEQLMSSRDVDARADIWSLGVILYELATGERPFLASSLAELGAMILAGTAPDVRVLAPEVSESFATVVRTCLQRRVEDRYQNLGELAVALAPCGSPTAWDSAVRIGRALGLPISVPSRPRLDSGFVQENVRTTPLSNAPRRTALLPGAQKAPPTSAAYTQVPQTARLATKSVPVPDAQSVPVPEAQTAGTWGSGTGVPSAAPRSASKAWIAVPVLALMSVGGGVIWATKSRHETSTASPQTTAPASVSVASAEPPLALPALSAAAAVDVPDSGTRAEPAVAHDDKPRHGAKPAGGKAEPNDAKPSKPNPATAKPAAAPPAAVPVPVPAPAKPAGEMSGDRKG